MRVAHVADGRANSAADVGAFARKLYRERRLRDATISEGLFGEPGWDILLDLFASEAEGKSVTVGSACLASAVPASTAIRYVSELERRGLIVRKPSVTDRRTQVVTLTESAHAEMTALLKRLRDSRHARGC